MHLDDEACGALRGLCVESHGYAWVLELSVWGGVGSRDSSGTPRGCVDTSPFVLVLTIYMHVSPFVLVSTIYMHAIYVRLGDPDQWL